MARNHLVIRSTLPLLLGILLILVCKDKMCIYTVQFNKEYIDLSFANKDAE